jgi:hypothetical protein
MLQEDRRRNGFTVGQDNGGRMVLGFRSDLVTDWGSANHLGLETEMETGSEMEKETWLDLVRA